jgi:hypothetical protein
MLSAGVNGDIGYAFADAIILPIAPDYLVRVVDGPSCYVEIGHEEVDALNAWQVRGAFSHVYLRPGSRPEQYIRSVDWPGRSGLRHLRHRQRTACGESGAGAAAGTRGRIPEPRRLRSSSRSGNWLVMSGGLFAGPAQRAGMLPDGGEPSGQHPFPQLVPHCMYHSST